MPMHKMTTKKTLAASTSWSSWLTRRQEGCLVSLPFLCVEAHAQAEGIDGEREDNCRTLLCGDRIERLKKPSVRHRWSEDERENQNKWTNRAIVWFFGDMEKSNWVDDRYSTNMDWVGNLNHPEIIIGNFLSKTFNLQILFSKNNWQDKERYAHMMSRLVYQLQTLRQDHLGNDSGPLCGPWGVPRSICVCMCRNTSHTIFPEVDRHCTKYWWRQRRIISTSR